MPKVRSQIKVSQIQRYKEFFIKLNIFFTYAKTLRSCALSLNQH